VNTSGSRDNRRLRKVSTPNNLPAELSSFVGRERQLAELRRLLRKSRLITLTGPGGAGKTRLALRLATEVLDRHPDGVWLVDLAVLSDVRLLEQTVAAACGVREERRQPMLEVLVQHLGARRTLLILDSCEHLVDPCAVLVGTLLRSCPKLTFVVTTREPLGVPGEVIWRTPSLSLPRLENSGHAELMLESEAVRLYVDRARLSQPGFDLAGTASADAVAQICTRLEGMPLAIELAASLTRVMTTQEILERLRDRFRVLTGGSRSALPRHQTLRQTVDWSYGLLSPAEKALLARLSLFAGGFDLAAAEAVAEEEDPGGVLPVLSRLVDKSLVSAEAAGSKRTRYRMLDTIREYALEKLQEGDEARRLMARYYVEYCSRAAKELRRGDQMVWLALLDEEQANIRLALGWSLIEQPDDALRLVAAMGPYWHMRRHFAEGLEWLDQALELPASNAETRAVALWARSRINWRHGENAQARRDAEECAALTRRLGLRFELSGALTILGLVSSSEGDWSGAERYHNDALEIARELNDPGRLAGCLNNIALGVSARGDHKGAAVMLQQALEACRKVGDRFQTAAVMDSLARVTLRQGAFEEAQGLYLEGLTISAEFEDAVNIAVGLEGLALIAAAEGASARALVLAGAAKELRTAVRDEPTPEWSDEVGSGLAAARAKLGAQAADAAVKEGRAMSMQEAVRYAIGAAPSPTRVDGNPLTGREAQVAVLIADGFTNGEIAKTLRIAVRTADAHVEHIRNKLGLRSRSQIAVWAHDRLGRT
jgi:predicted ATPase/DNA-binding CsgD family transcriptional regulator